MQNSNVIMYDLIDNFQDQGFRARNTHHNRSFDVLKEHKGITKVFDQFTIKFDSDKIIITDTSPKHNDALLEIGTNHQNVHNFGYLDKLEKLIKESDKDSEAFFESKRKLDLVKEITNIILSTLNPNRPENSDIHHHVKENEVLENVVGILKDSGFYVIQHNDIIDFYDDKDIESPYTFKAYFYKNSIVLEIKKLSSSEEHSRTYEDAIAPLAINYYTGEGKLSVDMNTFDEKLWSKENIDSAIKKFHKLFESLKNYIKTRKTARRVIAKVVGTHMGQDLKKKLNKKLYEISTHNTYTYYTNIPIKDIFAILDEQKVTPVQEDGTHWSGFLTGATGHTSIDLQVGGLSIDNAVLDLKWHKMPSGKYEIIAYIS